MVKSIARKRKRQFYGNKFTNTSKNNSNSAFPECTASSSKLRNASWSTADEMPGPMFGNRIVDLELIVKAFAQLCFPKYFSEKVELFEDSRYGLCSHFTLKCKCCDFFFAFASSKKVVNAPFINTRLVYGMRQIGKGFAEAFKFCSTLNLPQLTKTAYKNQEAKLLKVVQEVAEESMIKASTEIVEKKQNLSSDIVKCGISVDGTWQRRGFTSMNGCVAAISVDTGKVLDIEVMPSYCPTWLFKQIPLLGWTVLRLEMPQRRNRGQYEQLSDFKRKRVVGFIEAGSSNKRVSAAISVGMIW
ncbi:uncharacterized protein TNCV_985691 [Trichonephila clavipes]|uniref:Mutator-like transposase domain-containing protein n=1 Tax=Trichonephila clavipes TaxID=2585209 RepID=A0A8X6SRA9_TRICX|nr:uncharacterized protein TNCV_985691 [Trichonephila clavipes]